MSGLFEPDRRTIQLAAYLICRRPCSHQIWHEPYLAAKSLFMIPWLSSWPQGGRIIDCSRGCDEQMRSAGPFSQRCLACSSWCHIEAYQTQPPPPRRPRYRTSSSARNWPFTYSRSAIRAGAPSYLPVNGCHSRHRDDHNPADRSGWCRRWPGCSGCTRCWSWRSRPGR